MKTLQVKKLSDGRTVSLTVSQPAVGGDPSKSVSVTVSQEEFAVISEIVRYLIPRLLGFDIVNQLEKSKG
jgi:hypothetical protein